MLLINCKVHLELNWIEDCILSSTGNFAKFEITEAKLHIPIVILTTTDSLSLTKQLSKGFKRSVYLNNYQTKPAKVIEAGIKENKEYFLPRGEIKNYNVLIGGRNIYD